MSDELAKQSEVELTHRVLEATPDHVSIVGPDYRYRFVNKAYEKAHGRPAADIIGVHVSDVLGPEAFEKLARPRLDGCLGGQEVGYEAWFEFERQGRRYMFVRYLPLVLNDQPATGVLVIARFAK